MIAGWRLEDIGRKKAITSRGQVMAKLYCFIIAIVLLQTYFAWLKMSLLKSLCLANT